MSHSQIAPNAVQQETAADKHAIVIGGSIAGLLVARVLADYFDRVTIIERDVFPEKPMPRAGVPQSHQLHALLTQGLVILEQLFPGFKDELAAHGAITLNWTADFQWLLPGGWTPRFPSEIISCSCTRNLLEFIIRKRLTSNTRVELLEASIVTGLLSNLNKTAVTGVRFTNTNGAETELSAQLVVDASGRNSKAPKWLQALDYDPPKETVVNSFLGYSTRWYQCLTGEPLDYKVLYILPSAPEHSRGGAVYQVEGNRWIVTLVGVGKDYPPTDEMGFLDFARSLRSPKIYEVIQNAQPLTPVYGYQRTENRLRHYEGMSGFPENFLIVGDAVCSFNPVYGQGMTVAALGALTLNKCLEQRNHYTYNGDITGLGKRFQQELSKVNIVPWLVATGDDFRWPTTEGGQPSPTVRFMHWYLDQVILGATKNAKVYKVFLEVLHLLKPPTALFQPSILAQVLRQMMNRHSN